MLRIFKCLLLPFLLAVVTQSSTVIAESIRLTGPDSELRATSRYSDLASGQRRDVSEPSRFYGPTTSQETLWSIASRLRPSASVTVQQTLFAIYQLNPQAFANQNIHELIPGSTLRIPSLAQAQGVSTQEAVNIMAAHQARLSGSSAPKVRRPQSQAPVTPQIAEAEAKGLQQETMAKEPMVKESSDRPTSSLDKIVQKEHKNQVKSLESQLENSESELLALEEKNHKLRLMLADVQSEVDVLKDELGDESRIRSEVEKLIEAERERLAEEQRLKPTALDDLLSSTAFVSAMAIIPGLLIGLVLMTLLGRRKKEAQEQPQAAASAEPTRESTAPVAPPPIDEDVGDDLLLDDDLFGESSDEDQLFSDELEEGASDEEDVFADLEENDLDFNLEGEDGEDPFAGIGDDGELDESLAELDTSADDSDVGEALTEGDEPEGAFDLSEDSDDITDDELDSLLASDGESEDLDADELDQSLLDDLFNESDSDDGLDFDSLLDENDETDSSEDTTDALDELLDEGGDTELPGETELLYEALDKDSVDVSDDSTDLLDELIDEGGGTELPGETELLDEALGEDSVDVSDDSTDLLDELIDEGGGTELPGETELLDEALGEDSVDVSDDSTDLLDELIDEGGDTELPGEAELLDEFLVDDQEEGSLTGEIGDDVTNLFEELVDIDSQSDDPSEGAIDDIAADSSPDFPVSGEDFSSEDFMDDMLSAAPDGDPLLDEFDLDASSDSENIQEDIVNQSEPKINSEEPEPDSGETASALAEEEPYETSSQTVSDASTSALTDSLFSSDGDAVEEDILAQQEQSQAPKENEDPAVLDEDVDLESEVVESQAIEEPDSSDIEEPIEDSDTAELEEPVALDENVDLESEAVESEAIEEPDSSDIEEPIEDSDTAELEEPVALDENVDLESEVVESEATEEPDPSDIEEPIEDSDTAELEESAALDEDVEHESEASEVATRPEAIPNEFGIPQGDDWLTEEDAAAELGEETELEAPAESQEGVAALDDAELPEYTEEDAAAESGEETELEAPAESQEEVAALDDAELPEYTEEDAAAELGEETELEAPAESQEEVAALDDAELPEYTEEDAAAELGEETGLEAPAESQEEVAALDDAELPISSGVTQEKPSLDLSDLDIPKYGGSTEEIASEAPLSFDTDDGEHPKMPEPEGNEEDFKLDEVEIPSLSEIPSEAAQELANNEYNEAAFEELLSEDTSKLEEGSFDLESPDSITSDSAGLDIEAMLEVGGEDWNGFNLSPEQQSEITDDIPEDEQGIWDESNSPEQAQVLDENWGNQEELEDFVPDESEFKSIDELMAEVDNEEQQDIQEEDLQLDVGLNDFPDVIGDTGNVDVDDNSEAAGKLDLAKIYIEMNDPQGAIKLLEEAIVDGSDEIRREAKNLIDTINGRG